MEPPYFWGIQEVTNQPTWENQRLISANQPRQQMHLCHLEPCNGNQYELHPSGNAWCTFARPLGLMENVELIHTPLAQMHSKECQAALKSFLSAKCLCKTGDLIITKRIAMLGNAKGQVVECIVDSNHRQNVFQEYRLQNHQKTSSQCIGVIDESKPKVNCHLQ